MACDYFIEKWGDYCCMLKNTTISYDQYQNYCKRDNRKTCPIYLYTSEIDKYGGKKMPEQTCPSCGFHAHFVCSDGRTATYQCERCKAFFKLPL